MAIKTTTGDWSKLVVVEKKDKGIFYYWKKSLQMDTKWKRNICLENQTSNNMRLYFTISITAQISRLNCWKILQTSRPELSFAPWIHPSKHAILQNYWMLCSETKNNLQQPWIVSTPNGSLIRFLISSKKKFRTKKFCTKFFHACVTRVTYRHFG